MADLQSVVELIFRGVDQVSDTTQSVSNKLAALEGAGHRLPRPGFAKQSDLAFEASVIAVATAYWALQLMKQISSMRHWKLQL
ncbi:MAG: hypothetical protein IPK79_14345 [Vampirovibrionales bacterium]|nr:hypothetical protein [Vampirovibrionales bacterium]